LIDSPSLLVFDKYNETVFASNLRVVYICPNTNTTALSVEYLTYQIRCNQPPC
jgi:hypothetical protein